MLRLDLFPASLRCMVTAMAIALTTLTADPVRAQTASEEPASPAKAPPTQPETAPNKPLREVPMPPGKNDSRLDQGLYVPTPSGRKVQIVPMSKDAAGAPPALASLPMNHRITITVRRGETVFGEVSTLTASAKTDFQGLLMPGAKEPEVEPLSVAFTAVIQQFGPAGQLTVDHTLRSWLPQVMAVGTGAPSPRQIEFFTNSATGSLRVQPGKAYEIHRASGITYLLTITPESEK